MTTTPLDTFTKIQSFWDDRARQFGADGRATLRETHLRDLEIKTMRAKIARLRPRRVLDVGCGNGFSTRRYAAAFPHIQFIGIDFSPEMIRHARSNVPANCAFHIANVLDPASLPRGPFDLIITQRCLQNLLDWPTQKQAIANLSALLSRASALLLMECSKDGVTQLNHLRADLGRTPIEGIEPWHNNFLRDHQMIEELGARIEYFSSTYMFLAKVLHKKLSYIARHLPAFGRFGYNRLYVLQTK